MIGEYEKTGQLFISQVKKLAEENSLEELSASSRDTKRAAEAFAAVYLAVQKGLGVTPFDTQICAGAALDDTAVVELATGEGKTIAAVFAAYYSVIQGLHVNIFTFNDYLAARDCEWMRPVYELLGVSVSFVSEQLSAKARQAAYKADVTYSTVKECGFDYLRDFLAESSEKLVSGKLERAIVDEADSVLIDEARIPLVAAGSVEIEQDKELADVFSYVKTLLPEDYEVSIETESAYLTDEGARKTEKHYHLNNLYDEENNALMIRLNDSLKALYIVAENRDYIVKNGEICLIDRFTGRVAEGRHFPGTLQSAVELKHGLNVTERGVTMATIAIQNFVRLFPKISGMTGTAQTAKDEFDSMYGMIVKHIEPNTPSARTDLPIFICYNSGVKLRAVTDEISAAHEKGQPVLVGTDSISQSEELSRLLDERGIAHAVLNAKNDESEAEIISNAGKFGAVTISTNMAGRGVDIKLGGADEKERERVLEAGGLYVIGTFLAESERINNQLKGRAGRQGDPGQSRLFVSLDEEIMERCKLKKLVGSRHYPAPSEDELTDKVLIREVMRVQRISQGKTLDERVRLMKFSMINEKHRQQIFDVRRAYLTDERCSDFWEKEEPQLAKKLGTELEKKAILCVLNRCWADYLEYTSALREGIHLSAIGGKDPAEEYNIACENYYLDLEDQISERMSDFLAAAKNGNISIPFPAKTWTYLLADNGDELERRSLMSVLFGDDEPDEEEVPDVEEAAPTETEPKKGFFARLFGKK